MAYQKRYRTIVPVPRGEDVDQELLVWLTRESFTRAAEADSLVVVNFIDGGEVAPDDIPPKAEKQLGKPAAEFVWRLFEGVGQRAESI